MAVVNIYGQIANFDLVWYGGNVTVTDPGTFTFDSYYFAGTVVVSGTGFTYDGSNPTGGTYDSIRVYSDSSLTTLVAEVTGLSSDLSAFYFNVATDLAGSDLVTGGNLDENVTAYDGDDSMSLGTTTGNGTNYNNQYGYGDLGNDVLTAGQGYTQLFGGEGNDVLDVSSAGANNDGTVNYTTLLFGDEGDDTLIGSDGIDTLYGGSGLNSISAGAGDDRIVSTDPDGVDIIDGGAGTDSAEINRSGFDLAFVADFSDPNVLVTLTDGSSVVGVEQVVFFAGSGNDVITASNFETYNYVNSVYGGDGNDTLRTSTNGASLYGGEGDDLIASLDASSTVQNNLNGGEGNDTILGGAGLDTINGDAGNDTIALGDNGISGNFQYAYGGSGRDTLTTGAGHSILSGGTGNDIIDASGAGENAGAYTSLDGGDGNDVITGSAGADVIHAGRGFDIVDAGAGDDQVNSEDADDLDGGDGFDTLSLNRSGTGFNLTANFGNPAAVSVLGDGTTITGFERVAFTSGSGDDTVTASNDTYSYNNTVYAGDGDDTLFASSNGAYLLGEDGNDVIDGSAATAYNQFDGGSGDDVITGGSGTDYLTGGSGNDTIALGGSSVGGYQYAFGGAGRDTITAADGANDINGGDGNDIIDVSAAGENTSGYSYLFGESGHDVLIGSDGQDYIYGGSGNDLLRPGRGTGTVQGGTGTDTIDFSTFVNPLDPSEGLIIDLTDQYAESASGDVNITVSEVENVIGSAQADTIIGGAGINVIDGGEGDDFLYGGSGNDIYHLGDDADQVSDSSGLDLITSTSSRNLNDYGGIEDLTLLGTGNVDGTGNSLDNNLVGNSGNNVLDGGAGNDYLAGGEGNDTYVLGADNDVVDDSAGTDTITSSISRDLSDYSGIENLTLTGSDNVNATGDGGANVLTGNSGNNVLDGGAGSDTLVGGAGDDTYVLGDGSDSVSDSAGTDTITSTITRSLATHTSIENLTLLGSADIDGTGNALANTIIGNDGNNILDGGAGIDTLDGGAGDDTYNLGGDADVVSDSAGLDTITSTVTRSLAGTTTIENLTLLGTGNINGTGNDLDNTITGTSGNNVLDGGAGSDTLIGGAGNDTYVLADGMDAVTDTSGVDTIQSTVTRSLASYTGIENLTLTGSDNVDGTGNGGANVLTGNSGSNDLYGGGGNDTLDGGSGVDALDGGEGNDTYVLADGADTVTDSGGTDTITSTMTRSLNDYSGIENLTLLGSGNINGTGDSGANTITGNDGNNVLDGGAGSDTLTGGAGNDTYVLGADNDTVSDSAGVDTVTSTVTRSLASTPGLATIENLTLLGSGNINGTGNALNNTITGNSGNNVLDGGAGTDTLNGGEGNDTYVLADGADTVVDSGGTDTITSTITRSIASQSFIENLTLAGSSSINGTGNSGANTITGNSGVNRLYGGDGDDTLTGLGGDDFLTGGVGADKLYGGDGFDFVRYDDPGVGDVVVNIANPAANVGYAAGDIYSAIEGVITGGGNDNLSGTSLANTFQSGAGDDIIYGFGGDDRFYGGAGADTFYGGDGIDQVRYDEAGVADIVVSMTNPSSSTGIASNDSYSGIESVLTGDGNDTLIGDAANNVLATRGGNDTVSGLAGNDDLYGDNGDDRLIGGDGMDDLYGGSGDDTFVFDSALGVGNVDTIYSYNVSDDVIELSQAIFSALSAGTLSGDNFVVGTAAADADDFVIFDAASGQLFYDADGSGSGAATQFAALSPSVALSAAEFIIVT